MIVGIAITGCAGLPVAPPAVPPPPEPVRTTTTGDTTVVAVTPAAREHPTLPEFLGIPQCCVAAQTCCARTLSCLGFFFPGLGAALEPTPPLLPLTDPANLASQNDTIQAAAEIKAEEDAAPQIISALRYLATIGCGCHPDVADAFLNALESCTEEVRYEAVLAIRKTASCCCEICNTNACCSAKIQKKLQEIAFETGDDGCPKEPSERVRRQARLALAACGPPEAEPQPAPEPKTEELETVPSESLEEAPADESGDEEAPTNDTEASSADASKASVASENAGSVKTPANVAPAAPDQSAVPSASQLPVFPPSIRK